MEIKKETTATAEQAETPRRVYFDKTNFEAVKKDYEISLGLLQRVIDDYEDLGVGKAGNDVFIGVISGNVRGTVKSNYEKKIETDVKKTTINPVLAEKLKSMLKEPFEKWAQKVENARRGIESRFHGFGMYRKRLHWEYFKFENGKVTFDVKALENEYSIYADTDNRKKFLELAEKTLANLQQLDHMVKECSGKNYIKIMPESAHSGHLFNYGSDGKIKLFAEFLSNIH